MMWTKSRGCHGRPILQALTQTCACRISCHLSTSSILCSFALIAGRELSDNCWSMCSKRSRVVCSHACSSYAVTAFFIVHLLDWYYDSDFFSVLMRRYCWLGCTGPSRQMSPHYDRNTASSLWILYLLSLISSCTSFVRLASGPCLITPAHWLPRWSCPTASGYPRFESSRQHFPVCV